MWLSLRTSFCGPCAPSGGQRAGCPMQQPPEELTRTRGACLCFPPASLKFTAQHWASCQSWKCLTCPILSQTPQLLKSTGDIYPMSLNYRVTLGPMIVMLQKVTWWTLVLWFIYLIYSAGDGDRTCLILWPHHRQPSSSPQHLLGLECF